MENPLVSVCIITYNHKKYIAQAIKSVLSQQASFDYEIIIADDCSTDGTREIVKNYKEKYPDLITLILQETNVGPGPNFVELIQAGKAKYIAYFEGDDYWIDPLKLQKQVDFLESNPDYSICFHRVLETFTNGRKSLSLLNPETTETTFTIVDLAVRNFIHTPSVVFRNGLFEFPDWYLEAPIGDYVMHLLNADKGKIRYLPDVMATYRRHGSGAWTSITDIQRHKKLIKVTELLSKAGFADNITAILKEQYYNISEDLFLLYLMEKQYDEYTIAIQKYFSEYPQRKDTWIYEKLPSFFNAIATSKTYELSKRMVRMARTLKLIS